MLDNNSVIMDYGSYFTQKSSGDLTVRMVDLFYIWRPNSAVNPDYVTSIF